MTNFIWNPVGGALSDRIGRKPVLLAIAVPVVRDRLSGAALARRRRRPSASCWRSRCCSRSISASTAAPCWAALVEIVPAHVRTTCFSLAFALAAGLFGTFTPFASTWLIDHTGDKASPGYWLMFAAALGIIAALVVYRGGKTIEARDSVMA